MARTTFTLELLKWLQDTHGAISFDLLRQELKGWKLKDIKARLSAWRYRGAIAYTLNEHGELKDLAVLKIGRQTVKVDSRGAVIRSWLLCEVVSREMTIAEDTTSNKNQIRKTDDLIAKYISRIPDDMIAQYFEELPEALAQYLKQQKKAQQ